MIWMHFDARLLPWYGTPYRNACSRLPEPAFEDGNGRGSWGDVHGAGEGYGYLAGNLEGGGTGLALMVTGNEEGGESAWWSPSISILDTRVK